MTYEEFKKAQEVDQELKRLKKLLFEVQGVEWISSVSFHHDKYMDTKFVDDEALLGGYKSSLEKRINELEDEFSKL